MTPEEFFEQMKNMFEKSQTDEKVPNTSRVFNNKVIVKPKKQYIKAKEILDLFGFSKAEYNNILVRRNKKKTSNINFIIINFVLF